MSKVKYSTIWGTALGFERRLLAGFQKTENCWLWQKAKNQYGYGLLGRSDGGRRVVLAHRSMWEREYGPIPIGVFVCHHCDTPACVRPDHLFLGTQADNLHDMLAKGRRPKVYRKRVSV